MDVTKETRKLVWEGMLDADRLGRYYGRVAEKYDKVNVRLTWVAGAFAVGGAVVAVLGPDAVAAILSGVAGAVSGYLGKSSAARRAAMSSARRQGYGRLHSDWLDLWSRTNRDDADDDLIRAEWRLLFARADDISATAELDGREDKKLNLQSRREATMHLPATSNRHLKGHAVTSR